MLPKIPYYRFVVLIVTFVCLMSVFSNYTIMNFSFICMKSDMYGAYSDNNGTLHSIYDYTSSEKAEIIWAVAIGTIVGTIPYNWAYVKYGAKYVFLSAGILSTISTALVPILATNSYLALLAVRFLQGLAYSADFAVIGIICVKWAPHDEVAFFISVLTIFSSFANIITTSITGYLCTSSLGWRYSYYFHAVGGAVCFLLWWIVYTDHPLSCESVTTEELVHIQKEKSAEHFNKNREIPFLKMITNPALACVWFNAFMDLSMSIMIITYSPIYIHGVLGYKIEETAALIGITTFGQLPFKFLAAYISDRITYFSPKTKMYFFQTFSCGIVSILFAGFGFIPKSYGWLAMVLLTVIQCLMTTNCGGFYQCGRYVAQQYTDVVIAAIQFCKCLALFFTPAIVSLTVSDEKNRSQWALSFLIMSAFLFAANLSAYIFFTDKPAKFTNVKEEPEKLKELST